MCRCLGETVFVNIYVIPLRHFLKVLIHIAECAKRQIVENYDQIIMEMDGRMINLADNITRIFGDHHNDCSTKDNMTRSRRIRAQMTVNRALKSDVGVLDLPNIFKIFNLQDVWSLGGNIRTEKFFYTLAYEELTNT